MYTDSFFLWAADEAVRIQLSRNIMEGGGASIYYYYFAFRGHRSFSELFGDPTRDFGELQKKICLCARARARVHTHTHTHSFII